MDIYNDVDSSLVVPLDPAHGLPEIIQGSQAMHGQNQAFTSTPTHPSTAPDLETSPASNSQTKSSLRPFLSEIPTSDRYFWKGCIVEQLTLEIADKYPEQYTRAMAKHEILVMALNEIAVHHGYGFFFHLPSKDGQRTPPKEEVCPPSRRPPSARSDLPNIYFMRRGWTPDARRSFFRSAHPIRYLHCDGLLGIPDDDTPLYAIQHVFHLRASAFVTTPPSLVAFTNSSALYLASSENLKRLVGAEPVSRLAEGSRSGSRLCKTPYLWDDSPSTELQAFAQLSIPNMEELYRRILQECSGHRLRPTFTALELRRRIPRAVAPDRGFDLGTLQPFETETDNVDGRITGESETHNYSGPQSRRGGRLVRGRRGRT